MNLKNVGECRKCVDILNLYWSYKIFKSRIRPINSVKTLAVQISPVYMHFTPANSDMRQKYKLLMTEAITLCHFSLTEILLCLELVDVTSTDTPLIFSELV